MTQFFLAVVRPKPHETAPRGRCLRSTWQERGSEPHSPPMSLIFLHTSPGWLLLFLCNFIMHVIHLFNQLIHIIHIRTYVCTIGTITQILVLSLYICMYVFMYTVTHKYIHTRTDIHTYAHMYKHTLQESTPMSTTFTPLMPTTSRRESLYRRQVTSKGSLEVIFEEKNFIYFYRRCIIGIEAIYTDDMLSGHIDPLRRHVIGKSS